MGSRDISKTMVLKDGVSKPLKKINQGVVEYRRNLQDLRDVGARTWSAIRSGLTSIGVAAAGAATAIAGVAGVSSVLQIGTQAASDLENYRLTLETVLKDTKKAGDLMKWAGQFANITPFDTSEVIEGTVRLEAYGISAQGTMRQIGDMAAVMNKDLMQAIEAVADAQTGELERLKEFGITKAMIEKKAGEMFRNQVVVNNKGQIVDQQKFNEALFALMDERFKGGMERQSSTFKGLMSTITGTWSTGLAEMMGVSAAGEVRAGSLFATLKSSAESAASVLTQMAEDGTFQRWGDNLASIVSGTATAFAMVRDNWPVISPIIYGIVGTLSAYKAAVLAAKAANVIKTASVKTMAWWTTFYGNAAATTSGKMRIMTLVQHGLNAAMRANPIGMVITLLGLLVVAGIYVVKNWEQIKLAGMRTWNIVVDAAEWGVNKFIDFANFVFRAYKFAWDSIEFAGKSIWNGILAAGEAGVNGFISLINWMIEKSLDGINSMIRGANKVASNLGIGSVMDEITFNGIDKVSFDGAKAVAEKPKWDSGLNVIPQLNFDGAKFSEDSLMEQTTKAQRERDKKKGKSEEALATAIAENTAALTDNTSATGANTAATGANTAVLLGNKSATDIADSLLARIERHLYAT